MTPEHGRLQEAHEQNIPWKKWGPYLSERHDLLLFYEYFHCDNGAGLGASHQAGWTGIVARGMHLFATTTAEQALELSKKAAGTEVEQPQSGRASGVAQSRGR